MRTIEYEIVYSGTLNPGGSVQDDPIGEIVSVQARDINSGFSKALKRAREPLGNGRRREIASVRFWQIP